jgi:hypothetical protein
MAYLTYFDLVESLITSSYGGPQDAEQRDIRTAIHRAYNELTTIRDWSYYHVHGRVITRPSQTASVSYVDGPVVYTQAGLPASDYTHIRAGDRVAQIEKCLDPGTNTAWSISTAVPLPADTLQPGDTLTFYKSIYALPSDFRNLDEPSDEFNWWSGMYVTPDQAMKTERVNTSAGAPYHWTVIKDPLSTGWALKLVGYPSGVETIDFTYRRSARPLKYSGHEAALRQGTIARSVRTITGSGTAFPADAAGAILRVGTTADSPGTIESLTPWVAESLITTRTSATSMQTDATGTIASTTRYLITDPIDIPAHMYGVMDSACDYFLARIRGKDVEKAAQLYQRDLRLAMEMDQLAPLSGRSREVWHDGGWRSPLQADGG